ncbi:MAG: hypothetical protein L3K06_02290 [Thermoplasmata archaeon]|nr:hypothetical protein [Thermoplasmata archaeon]
MLIAFWSSKGGSGTSVVAAACALVLARSGHGARLADLGGDQSAIFGLAAEPETGLVDWLAAGPEAPGGALDRLTVSAAPGVVLVPRGGPERTLAPLAAAEAGAALSVALRDGPVPTLVDVGQPNSPAARALVEVADSSILVLRGCYLALRRAVRSPLLARAAGVVLLEGPVDHWADVTSATCSISRCWPGSPCAPRLPAPWMPASWGLGSPISSPVPSESSSRISGCSA